MKTRTKILATGGTVAVAYLSALAPASPAATVCNEAENSHRGGYEVTGGIVDPVPPAFLRGSQMRVGNDHSAGLDHAADRSPALRQCGPADDGGGDGGGGNPT
ncbi:MAG TPA: hypothetical protein VHU24_10440 [Solirubrobacterales bacterium]|nr:hypothetical protein [Solirubrobacterales bacterium]